MKWRAEQGENKNWEISLKTEAYERKKLSEVGEQIFWIIQNASQPPTVQEIVEHLMIDGNPMAPRTVKQQRNGVQNVLQSMRRRGLVESHHQGEGLRWALSGECPPSVQPPSPQHAAPITDSEWAVLRWHLPLPARRRSSEENTRLFILAVIMEAANEDFMGLMPGQQKRFLSWLHLKVWDEVVGVLGGRFTKADLETVARKIADKA